MTTTPGGALIEYQHFTSDKVLRMAASDAVGAATAPPVPLIMAVAAAFAVATAILRRY